MPSLYGMTTATTPRPASSSPAQGTGRRPRRVQRLVVGLAMSIVAFVLERIVARAMRRSEQGR